MTERLGIAIDIGTSGLRAQSVDLQSKRTIATAITLRHPVPGANVMDHLNFAIDVGRDKARKLIMDALGSIISQLSIDLNEVSRVAVCGNPIQLSLFQDMEIRDLAYAGERAKKKLGIDSIRRDSKVVDAGSIGLPVPSEAEVYIPPSVKHEIGADALAMMYQTDFLNIEETSMVTDYGTNAEMALKVDDEIITGSAAAGPAIEGQHIGTGMLAAPGAISDMENFNDDALRTYVLNENLIKKKGDVINPVTGEVLEIGEAKVRGLTGTGVVALVATGLESGILKPGKILNEDRELRLQNDMVFKEDDLKEVGKTIAAFTAGHMTLTAETGISLKDIESMYMTGASGTYVDAKKAMKIGLVPGTVRRVMQVGNTSLALANDLVKDPDLLDSLQETADSIRARHLMFANSESFKNAFAVELGVWTQGMAADGEAKMLKHFGLEEKPPLNENPTVNRLVERDIQDIGYKGLSVVEEVGAYLKGEFEGCIECFRCVDSCNEEAITVEEGDDSMIVIIDTGRCMGTACRKCERACKEKILKLEELSITER